MIEQNELKEELFKTAQKYQSMGIAVGPCQYWNKYISLKGGHERATTDMEELKKLFENPKITGISIVPRKSNINIVAIDVDEHAGSGKTDFEELEEELGEIPRQWEQKTTSDGIRILMLTRKRFPETVHITNNIDLLADGQECICVAPSRAHKWQSKEDEKAGKPQKIGEYVVIHEEGELPPLMPEAWESELWKRYKKAKGKTDTKNTYDRPDIKRQLEELTDVKGNRHDTLKSYFASVISRTKGKLSDREYEVILREANEALPEPIPQREFDKTVLPMLEYFRNKIDAERDPVSDNAQSDFRDRFHVWSRPNTEGVRYPTDIIESEITEDIVNSKNIIVISGLPYIYHDGVYEQDETGNNTRAIIKEYIFKRLHTVNRINRVYNLLIMDTSIVKDIDEVNAYPKRWINFKNGMLDTEKMEMHEHRPEYYSINQIPWEYKQDYTIPADSMVIKCLKEKIPDEEDREMFLQFNGYGLTTDTHAQKFMVYFGDGNTGKSTLIRLQDALIGKQNRTSLSLQDINKRFFPTCLFGKLMNLCADIPSEAMSAIDVLKKATGEDQIMGEYKGGAVFFFKSYAKLLFSANSIPLSYDDKTNAFYRRMLLLEIQRGEFMSDLEDKLYEDMQTYIHLCVDALHRMYERGELLESENSKNEVDKLRMKADTVFAFMSEQCERDNSKTTKRDELYRAYDKYCTEQDRTALTKHRFYSTLEDNGIPTRTGDRAMYVKGIYLKTEDDIPFT